MRVRRLRRLIPAVLLCLFAGVMAAAAAPLGPAPSQATWQVADGLRAYEEAGFRRKARRWRQWRQRRLHDMDRPRQQKDASEDSDRRRKPIVVKKRRIAKPARLCDGDRRMARRCPPTRIAAPLPRDKPQRVAKLDLRDIPRAPRKARTRHGPAFAPREIVLAFPLSAAAQIEDDLGAIYRLQLIERSDVALIDRRIVRYRIPDSRSLEELLAAIRGNRRIATVQPNYRFRREASAQIQYALAKLDIDAAHGVATGKGSLVAVIDTGIDATHPDLRQSVWRRFDAAGDDAPIADPHGTAVAGIIAAHGQIGGVAPEARLLDIRAFLAEPEEQEAVASTVTLLRGLQWAADNGARVVNMSLSGPRDELMGQAVAALIAKGIVIVAAAGNDGASAPEAYPAAFDGVIAVTATDATDALYDEANRGAYIAVAAPGVDVIAPALNEAYLMNSGTSFAAAHVSGIVALMLERDPRMTVKEIRAALLAKAVDLGPPGPDDQFGAGRVNALAVLQ